MGNRASTTVTSQFAWGIEDSQALYNVAGWGHPYFQINQLGHVEVTVPQQSGHPLDLSHIVRDLQAQGLQLPLLVHFDDIVADRQHQLFEGFQTAISACKYPQPYRAVYPVKVNQQRHIVETVAEFGRRYGFGLEAGSKPELAIALSTMQPGQGEIVCNGYKDRSYIQLALMAQRLGHRVIIVLENPRELAIVLRIADEMQVRPLLGVRAKLWERSSGHWSQSVGVRAKFGLNTAAILQVLECLRQWDLLDCLQLLHYHVGSQVATLSTHARAVREAAQIFVRLAKAGAPMTYLDVGGGLSVDYDGSRTTVHSSCEYGLDDYASTIVTTVQKVCRSQGIAAPVLMSESGRATVSHQSVLIFDVLGTHAVGNEQVDVEPPVAPLVKRMMELRDRIPSDSLLADFRQIGDLKQEALQQFAEGELCLADRSRVEQLYWNCCQRLWERVRELAPENPEAIGLRELEPLMATMYYGNFSVFQSLPDSWAIDQIFPVMPIHRLNERPTVSATLVDLTCDSDGNLDRFVGTDGHISSVLPLHALDGADRESYWIGVFLTGAYQEILGDLHNLFGDTDAAHIRWDKSEEKGYRVNRIELGDRLSDVLGYVHFSGEHAYQRVKSLADVALAEGKISALTAAEISESFRSHLQATTYLR
ncbi:MAG: biosynthetic arginine decarboxylase [Cyanobacteria bacterium P01_E01_bin.34]